jgi:hypothetical protein
MAVDRPRAALQEWHGELEERDRAALAELAMARAPMRRIGRGDLPATAPVRHPAGGSEREGASVRGRPGKRW